MFKKEFTRLKFLKYAFLINKNKKDWILIHQTHPSIIIHITLLNFLMKVAILLALIAISMAASFDDVKAIIHDDQCAIEGLEYIKPKIHTQIQKLKEVLFQFKLRTQTTSLPRLNF